MNYTYKQLADTDVHLLKQLLTVFGEAFEEVEAYTSNIPNDDYLRSLLSKQHVLVLAALDGDAVVGGLVAYELEKFEQDRRELYIYDLAVAPEHRRKGIATQLISELKQLAKTRDAYVIFVQADQDDEPAIKLYESLGKKEDVHHFDIPLEAV